jgi:hypothetical protein
MLARQSISHNGIRPVRISLSGLSTDAADYAGHPVNNVPNGGGADEDDAVAHKPAEGAAPEICTDPLITRTRPRQRAATRG